MKDTILYRTCLRITRASPYLQTTSFDFVFGNSPLSLSLVFGLNLSHCRNCRRLSTVSRPIVQRHSKIAELFLSTSLVLLLLCLCTTMYEVRYFAEAYDFARKEGRKEANYATLRGKTVRSSSLLRQLVGL